MNIFTPPTNFSKVSSKLLSLLILLIFQTGFVLAQDAPFITVWQTDNPGSSEDNQITIPGTGTDYLIEWEEVGNEANNNGSETGTDSHTITFPSAGTYRVKISGDFTRINLYGINNESDNEKILDIEQWGNIAWSSFSTAFYGCSNLNQSATDVPDLSNVTIMYSMFKRASSFNSDIRNWNVSNVTNMNSMFSEADNFNQDISKWDVSNVANMAAMFKGASSFNGDIGNWNVSNVTDMSSMFSSANAFNQNISTWNVSNVTDMSSMFYKANNFNQDLGNWDVSNVTSMGAMFYNNSSFNGDIGSWNVSQVIGMSLMFRGASNFNQDLGNWDVSSVTNMENMFNGSGLSTYNYDQIIKSFATQENIASNISFGAHNMRYCLSEEDRELLIQEKGWTINGDFKDCETEPFISIWDSDNVGESESNQITIPASGGNYYILWEDVNNTEINGLDSASGHHTVTFPTAGTYRIRMLGELSGIYFSDLGDKLKITEIENWGEIQWSSFNAAFAGVENLTISDNDAPDLSKVTDMSRMFYNAKSLNQNISHWDVSNVTDMSDLFHGASSFNQDLSNWDVSNVTKMTRMFARTSAFNQDLNSWNTANVEEMDFMFWDADAFSGNISDWNTTNVNNMWGMFQNANSFDIDISNWDVSAVTNMRDMFKGTSSFNQDIIDWNVSNVTDMSGMFFEATAFDQNLGAWDLSNVTSLFEFLSNSGLSLANYDLSLEGWAISGNIASNIALSTDGLTYCLSTEYRQQLIDDFGIGIIGDNKDCETGAFISLWKTDNEGSSEDNQISIPLIGNRYAIDWEEVDNTENSGFTTASDGQTVTFPQPGTYRIRIFGDFNQIAFNDTGDKLKLQEINQWGNTSWSSMSNAFSGVENLIINTNDTPDLSMVTDMSYMFSNATNFNSDISNWDVSNITDMSGMFHRASAFNQDLSNWNVSNVNNMSSMFKEATTFNQDLNSWNTSNVNNMWGMFYGADSMNTDISNWDVSSVTNMTELFRAAAAFNQDINNWNTTNVEEMDFMFWDADAFQGNISDWNTENVTNMWGMFYGADSFNTDISTWNVSAVTNMTEMFRETSSFNQDLSNWNVSNVTEMSGMFYEASAYDQNLGDWNLSNTGSLFEFLTNSGISIQNYDLSLEGWATNGNIPSDIALSAEGLFYCASAEYRQQLIDDFGWNIMGDETCSLIMEETMPVAEATSVEKNTEIYLTFDQEIEEIDFSGITLKDVSGNAISLTDIYIDSLTLHLVHSGLGSNTYEVVIPKSSIISITGKENDSISWSFATQRILSSKKEQKLIDHSAFPNPFSDFTTIQFNLPQTQSVNLLVFDLKGQIVRQEQYDNLGSDKQSIKFERKDLPAGLYRYQLQSAEGLVGGKMLIK